MREIERENKKQTNETSCSQNINKQAPVAKKTQEKTSKKEREKKKEEKK